MTLHIIRSQLAFKRAEDAFDSADDILLIEDGVYCATQERNLPCKVFALKEDLVARALNSKLQKFVEQTDYSGFVRLTDTHEKIITW